MPKHREWHITRKRQSSIQNEWTLYQVIPKLLFKNNNKKVSMRTQQKTIFT
jgi:hypothetical protein